MWNGNHERHQDHGSHGGHPHQRSGFAFFDHGRKLTFEESLEDTPQSKRQQQKQKRRTDNPEFVTHIFQKPQKEQIQKENRKAPAQNAIGQERS